MSDQLQERANEIMAELESLAVCARAEGMQLDFCEHHHPGGSSNLVILVLPIAGEAT